MWWQFTEEVISMNKSEELDRGAILSLLLQED
jgi:hypothetical protein